MSKFNNIGKEKEDKKINTIINETITISKETVKRLLKDVKEMMKEPLDSHGIYYKHDVYISI
jgi:hypothetical protein